MTVGPLLLLALQAASPPQSAGAGGSATQIEQLGSAPTGRRATEAPPAIVSKADPSARITQLSNNLQPVGDGEDTLARPTARVPEGTRAAVEVARAIDTIKGRGQQPTPELIAREVGPEVLESYLSRGTPALPPPDAKPEAPLGVAPLGVTIIPPGAPQ